MSARNNTQSRTTSAYVTRVPCCKVCKDAGEPEHVYSSHYVKDRDGNVSCPKLKAIVCLNCGKRGHTSSYCKVPSREAAASTKAAFDAAKKPTEPPPTVVRGRFACLFEDDTDDEKLLARKHSRPTASTSRRLSTVSITQEKAVEASTINVSNVFDFPSLSSDAKSSPAARAKTTETKTFSYANMAAKPVEFKPVRQAIVIPTRPTRPASPTTLPPGYYGKKASELDWAALDSDSDDEDYDEEN